MNDRVRFIIIIKLKFLFIKLALLWNKSSAGRYRPGNLIIFTPGVIEIRSTIIQQHSRCVRGVSKIPSDVIVT